MKPLIAMLALALMLPAAAHAQANGGRDPLRGFKLTDTNGDGQLSYDEFKTMNLKLIDRQVARHPDGRLAAATHRLKASLSLGMRGVSSSLAMFATYRLDVFVVNYFLNPIEVGFYVLGVVISESLWQVPQAVAVTLSPRTARTVEQGSEQFTCFITRQVFLLACVMGAAMALASPVLIPLIFGSRFQPSVSVVWWILPGTIAFAVAKVMAADLTARGKPEYNSMIAVTCAVLTVLLDFALIPRMGIRGAALASSIAYASQALLIGIALRTVIKSSWTSMLLPSYADLVHYVGAVRRGMAFVKSGIGLGNRK